jgi:signal transduction histidine kinase
MSISAHGDYRVVLEDQDRYILSQRMVYIEDTENTLGIEDVIRIDRSDWSKTTDAGSSFGYSQSAYWVYVPFKVDHAALWYVWLRYAPLDYVTLYWVKNGHVIEQHESGDALPFYTRQVSLPENIFVRSMLAGEKISMYIRIKTQGSYRIPLEVHQSKYFESSTAELLVFQGIYYGVLLVMSIFNFVLYLITGIRSYLHYVFYVATSLASILAMHGTGFQFLWPNSPSINEWGIPITFWLSSVAFWLFSYTFFNINKAGIKTKVYFWGLGVGGVVIGLGISSIEYHIIVPLITLYAMLIMFSSLIASTMLTLSGYRYAGVFAIAIMMTALSFGLTVFESLGYFSDQEFMLYGYPLARMFEIVLFAVALGVRIRFLQNSRIDAEKEAIVHREKSIKSIEQYKRLYESAMTGNFVLNAQGYVKNANAAFYELLGTDVNSNIQGYFNRDVTGIFKQRSKEEDFRIVKDIQSKNGKWVSVSLYKIYHEDEAQFEGSIVDISDRVRAQELQRQAEKNKMQALQQLVVGVAHEINTPLGIVRTSSDFAREILAQMKNAMEQNTLTKSEFIEKLNAGDEALGISDESVERIVELIKSFKHVSVEQMSFQIELFDMDVLSERLKDSAKLNNTPISIQSKNSSTKGFNTFTEGVYWFLNELLNNAHDYSNNSEGVFIDFSITDSEFNIHFYDKGEGVEDTDISMIFDPFFTTGRGAERKLGLGLYQAHNIVVQLLNGKINTYNDNGLHFKISIPIPDVISPS